MWLSHTSGEDVGIFNVRRQSLRDSPLELRLFSGSRHPVLAKATPGFVRKRHCYFRFDSAQASGPKPGVAVNESASSASATRSIGVLMARHALPQRRCLRLYASVASPRAFQSVVRTSCQSSAQSSPLRGCTHAHDAASGPWRCNVMSNPSNSIGTSLLISIRLMSTKLRQLIRSG